MDATSDELEGFLAEAAGAALFLDVDGTLVPIAATPDAVAVDRGVLETLAGLQGALGGAVALVSGRAIADLDRLFAPLALPSAGLHGLQHRDAGGRQQDEPADLRDEPGFDVLKARLADFAEAHPGVLLEDKQAAIALHYRQAPAAGEAARALIESLLEGRRDRLALVPGKMVLEIKPVGADKGLAIAAFMTEPPFVGRRAVFIGDDVTDEDGFRIVNDLGGLSVRVGADAPAAAATAASTAARARLPDVAAVAAWLARLLAAAEARQEALP